MQKKDIKTLIIIAGILVFISFISYIIFSAFNIKETSLNSSIIVDGNSYWQYQDKNWKDLPNMDSIDWKQYRVYTNNNYIDTYYVTLTNNKLYFFDKDNNSYHLDSPTLSISAKSNVSPIDYIEEDIDNDDQTIINSYLKSQKINYTGEYSIKEKYKTDLNNDQQADYIYLISNQLYSDNPFYIMFARHKNKNISIIKQIGEENIEQYKLAWILNITSDNLSNIILKKYYLDGYHYYLYKYDKKHEYEKLFNRKD